MTEQEFIREFNHASYNWHESPIRSVAEKAALYALARLYREYPDPESLIEYLSDNGRRLMERKHLFLR